MGACCGVKKTSTDSLLPTPTSLLLEAATSLLTSTASTPTDAPGSLTVNKVLPISTTPSPPANPECKIQMLLNWFTIDACFMAESWQIKSAAGFAGFLIHIFFVCVLLEFLRKMQREYDRYISLKNKLACGRGGGRVGGGSKGVRDQAGLEDGSEGFSSSETREVYDVSERRKKVDKFVYAFVNPTVWQQIVRTLIYTVQFGLAYYIMLMAMYYNGYIFVMLGTGIFTGHFLFGADNITTGSKQETGTSCC